MPGVFKAMPESKTATFTPAPLIPSSATLSTVIALVVHSLCSAKVPYSGR